jgi:hypothetical protein
MDLPEQLHVPVMSEIERINRSVADGEYQGVQSKNEVEKNWWTETSAGTLMTDSRFPQIGPSSDNCM